MGVGGAEEAAVGPADVGAFLCRAAVDCRCGGRTWRRLAFDTESTKEQIMNFQKWEVTIQTMTEAFKLETKEAGKSLVLTEWRKSLAKEPHLLKPFQIDEIVREVRKRSTPRHFNSNSEM